MARKKVSLYSSALRSAILAAPRRRTKKKRTGAKRKGSSWAAKVRRQARAALYGAPASAAAPKAFVIPGMSSDASALRLAALRGLSRHVGGAKVVHVSSNPRRKHMRKRHTRRARARRSSNPVILSNGRRRRTRRSRNPFTRIFNPGMGSIGALPGKALASVKSVASGDNVKKGAAIVGIIAGSWGIPARFMPAYDEGLKGIGLTAVTGALLATGVGAFLPALAPVAVLGATVATLLKAGFIYGRSFFSATPLSGIGEFLTLGQIPAGMIQGGRGMSDFLTTTGPVTAMGPGKSAALGGGENFSDFS